MDYTAITRMMLIFIAFTIAIWDAFLIYKGHTQSTFSVVLYESARQWPVIPFVAGFLCGHIFLAGLLRPLTSSIMEFNLFDGKYGQCLRKEVRQDRTDASGRVPGGRPRVYTDCPQVVM